MKKNDTRYLNILPDRDIVIFCRQKTKITNVISGGAEFDLVLAAASVEISKLKISEIELYSGTLPVRDNVPIFIYEKLCMEPFEKKAMTIIEEEMKEAVSKFYNFAPDQSACIVPQPEKKIYLNEMGFKSKKAFNRWRKNNDDPGCEYMRHSLDKKMMQYTSGSPIYRCIPTDKNNPSVGKCEYRRTKGQRCNIYRSASGKVSGDPKTGERISVRDLKPCDELNNFKCSVTKNTGFLSVFKGYTGICQ